MSLLRSIYCKKASGNRFKLFVFLVTSMTSVSSYAQDITSTNLTWTVNQLNDLTTSSSTDYACVFKTSSSGITWAQKNGTMTTPITIQSSSGQWNDVSAVGTFTYQVLVDGISGTMIFARDSKGVSIILDLTSNPDGFKHQYMVSGVAAQ